MPGISTRDSVVAPTAERSGSTARSFTSSPAAIKPELSEESLRQYCDGTFIDCQVDRIFRAHFFRSHFWLHVLPYSLSLVFDVVYAVKGDWMNIPMALVDVALLLSRLRVDRLEDHQRAHAIGSAGYLFFVFNLVGTMALADESLIDDQMFGGVSEGRIALRVAFSAPYVFLCMSSSNLFRW